MKKKYIITFCIALLVLLSVAIIALMLMLPQRVQTAEGTTTKYEAIKKTEYTFESTKDISKEALVKQYTITSEDIASFKKKNQYKAGNSDPFATPGTSGEGNGGSNSGDGSADDKTTNGNGGTPNPPSSNK